MMNSLRPENLADTAASTSRYDGFTIALHWLTAVLVVALFASAQAWDLFPDESTGQSALQAMHVSLGILLAAVVVVRGAWRLSGSRRLPAGAGVSGLLARSVHAGFYFLLVTQAGLGFILRWVQGEALSFFGLFTVPAAIAGNPSLEGPLGEMHELVAWTIVVLASGHAGAALFHHYVLKDRTLGRMLPLPR
jgi:cytochrome b561